MKNGKKIIILGIILLVVFFQSQFLGISIPNKGINGKKATSRYFEIDSNENTLLTVSKHKIYSIASLAEEKTTPYYYITNNSAFGPSGYDFPGSGNESDPYIITELTITESRPIFIIQNTNVHFKITDNTFNTVLWDYDVIHLSNVSNGVIVNNNINDGKNGIYLDSGSSLNVIENNTINENWLTGIRLDNSDFNKILDNDISETGYNISGSPIDSYTGRFSIHQIGRGHGIFLDPSNENLISNNLIHDNQGDGILLLNSNSNTITENIIYNNGYSSSGLLQNLYTGRFSIHQIGRGHGIFLDPSNNNEISNNVISNNDFYGIYIGEGSVENRVEWNDLIDNNEDGTSQANDNGSENTFERNYWNEFITPDNDSDGIVDNPYAIDGIARNYDFFPRATSLSATSRSSPGFSFIITMLLLFNIIFISKSKKKKKPF